MTASRANFRHVLLHYNKQHELSSKLGESADYKSVFVKKDSTPLERAVFARSGRRESGGKDEKSGQSLPSCQDNTGCSRTVRRDIEK
jgi:hypothetical protein